ncbi:SpoIIE family protein phosphatase [Treponema sp. C6A8]|uniref:SpoIIE family protein phosphatase n=1 Tax=Treponema sp. C6A8 TaxID=1410609 RepID=UPI0004800686|nr:SpoIIE family protein phosphatase [Treponema sp. C6A8]
MISLARVKKHLISFSTALILLFAGGNPVFAKDFYWENPFSFTTGDARFPSTLSTEEGGLVFWQNVDTAKKEIYISCRNYSSPGEFFNSENFAGPFSYSGDEVPYIYTTASLKSGLTAVAVLSEKNQISVYTTSDYGRSWKSCNIKTSGLMVAPRIFTGGGEKKDRFKMFISAGEENSFMLYESVSSDGLSWSNFEQFKPASKLRNPFLPYLSSLDGSDAVVFQAQYVNPVTSRISYQLYLTVQNSDNRSWSEAVLISDRQSLSLRDTGDFYDYQNQRPVIYNFDGKANLCWERTSRNNTSIWFAILNKNGIEPLTSESVTTSGNASRAVLFEYDDKLCLSWFDNRRGREGAYMALRQGSYWEEAALCENENSNQFVSPLILSDNNSDSGKVLTFVWQQTSKSKRNSIAFLAPDRSVATPVIVPGNFQKNKKSGKTIPEFQVQLPKDSSNIAGYSYIWTRNSEELPAKTVAHFPKETKIRTKALEGDGSYYLILIAQDYAGNWSAPAVMEYKLDTTPPLPPQLPESQACDKFGFLTSNSFRLEWGPSPSDDVVSYIYRLDYAGEISEKLYQSPGHKFTLSQERAEKELAALRQKYQNQLSKKRRMTGNGAYTVSGLKSRLFQNLSNGVYVMSVSSVDEVGNVSEPSQTFVFLNKYKPSTVIKQAELKKDEYGEDQLSIYGSGFTYDGTVTRLIIDRDGKAPYDLELSVKNNQFKVLNDSLISKIVIGSVGSELDEGQYKIGLYHTDRGLYFSGALLNIQQSGTLKIEGEYQKPVRFRNFKDVKHAVGIAFILASLLIIFICLVFASFLTRYTLSIYEEVSNKKIVKNLFVGGKVRMSKRFSLFRPSLRKKLVVFTFSLIIIVVMGVSVLSGRNNISLHELTLAEGLENRTSVLLESLCTGVKNFFPANNILELTSLPRQKDAMSEVEYVTIVGQPMNSTSSENLRYVWASNDPNILTKIDTVELSYGRSQITDEAVLQILNDLAPIDMWVSQNEQELSDKIEGLSHQADILYARGSDDDFAQAEYTSEGVVTLRNKIDSDLLAIAQNSTGSYPHFDSSNLDYENTDYIFYRPVLYRRGTTNNYVHAVVLVKLSTQTLVDSIISETKGIVVFGVIITVIALLIGMFGASLFAMIIVHPVRQLERHVQLIGRTKNKLNLKGKDIHIRSKDEIGRLGDAVNYMTHELVAVAEEEALTMDGKAVQNAFLPLTSDDFNNKKTTAQYKDDQVECFGYYEGESGVSGDYFDYRRLDKEWFVAIKCDASGHGIPAAIIMTVVATIFRRYFDHWTFKHDGSNINRVVDQINDFIEKLGLKGKFATLIICLINLKTGELYTCNAGDRIFHIFEAASRKIKTVTLASAPTAGVFSNDLLQMRGGFAVEKHHLNKGDVLYLYTDGIEESTRRVREADFTVKRAEINGKIDDVKEEFGTERITSIIESVLNRKDYELTKLENPRADEKLHFNFTKSQGTIEDSIIALASCEKVFRLYKTPVVPQTEYVRVDKKIDAFLKKYFSRYDFYAAASEAGAGEPNYVDYNQVLEDEQSDDLTLLAIKRL